MGGTPDGNWHARQEAWPRTVDFSQIASPPCIATRAPLVVFFAVAVRVGLGPSLYIPWWCSAAAAVIGRRVFIFSRLKGLTLRTFLADDVDDGEEIRRTISCVRRRASGGAAPRPSSA